MDIKRVLHDDHETLKSLIDTINESEDEQEITDTLAEFGDLLTAHSHAEEKAVYDPIIEEGGEEAQTLGKEGYVEHESAADLLSKLKHDGNRTDPPWKAKAKVLKEMLEHHIEEEESDIFDKIDKLFSASRREEMAEDFASKKKRQLAA